MKHLNGFLMHVYCHQEQETSLLSNATTHSYAMGRLLWHLEASPVHPGPQTAAAPVHNGREQAAGAAAGQAALGW